MSERGAPHGWSLTAGGGPLEAAGPAEAAVRALDRAGEATGAALRHLLEASGIDWTGPAAAQYRRAATDAVDDVRRARARILVAAEVTAEHAAAVHRAGAVRLGDPGATVFPARVGAGGW